VALEATLEALEESAFGLTLADGHEKSQRDDGQEKPDTHVEIDDYSPGIDANDKAGGYGENV